jgi:preprotein translocase subunit YajC
MLQDWLISAAYAQDAAAAQPSLLTNLAPMVLVIGIFYLLIIRPQQKKYKQHQQMINAVKRGDDIVTGGGIIGKVTRVEEGGKVKVQIAEGVEITVEQSTISSVLTKPGADDKETKDGKKQPKAANDNA